MQNHCSKLAMTVLAGHMRKINSFFWNQMATRKSQSENVSFEKMIDKLGENEKLIFSQQWMSLFTQSGDGTEKSRFSKRGMEIINPYGSELTRDEAQQVEAAAKFLSAFGRYPQFAGIARLMLEDNTEDEDIVLKTLQYALMKKGVAAGFKKLIEEKIEPVEGQKAMDLDAVREAFGEKHPMGQLLENLSNRYVKQQYKTRDDLMGKLKALKEMAGKFETVREYLAANGLK